MLPAYAGMIQPPHAARAWERTVLPAYAGMIRDAIENLRPTHRAPRVCGDDPIVKWQNFKQIECSPRMRG